MNLSEYILLFFYVFALFSLFVYGMNCYFLMLYYRISFPEARRRHQELQDKFFEILPQIGWPRVTIQLPISIFVSSAIPLACTRIRQTEVCVLIYLLALAIGELLLINVWIA